MNPLDVAIAAAREAGALLLAHRDLPLDAHEKGARGDIVTAADRASEALIVERLESATPSATILAEEGGARTGTSDERWIVDPLDGTTNYAHGYPLYCVSIAYERGGVLLAAAIYAPALHELYAAERAAGATCNGRRLAVSGTQTLRDALVCTGFTPAKYERNGKHFAALSKIAQGVRRDGSAALDLAFVARGAFDAFWEVDLHAWDVAAGALCVREAGGLVTAIDDEPFALGDESGARDEGSVLASNGKLHAVMRAALSAERQTTMAPNPKGYGNSADRDDHQHPHEHLDGTQHVHEHDHHDHDHEHEHHEHGGVVHSHALEHEADADS